MNMNEFTQKLFDPACQVELLDTPHKTLRSMGVELPDTTEVRVVRNGVGEMNLVVPASAEMDLVDSDLEKIAAGEVVTGTIVAATFLTVGAITLGVFVGLGAAEVGPFSLNFFD